MMWDLFGKSNFYWMQFERVRDSVALESLVPWLTAKLTEFGEDAHHRVVGLDGVLHDQALGPHAGELARGGI